MSDSTWGAKASDETRERLAKLFEASDVETQKEFLEDLVRVYELNQAKQMVPIIGPDLDELQQLTNRINTIFIGIGERINTLFTSREQDHQAEIDKKQCIIDTLQGRITQIASERDEAEGNYQELTREMEKLSIELVNLKGELERQVNQFSEVNQSNKELIGQYKDKIDTLSGLLSEYQEAKEENAGLSKALQEAEKTIDAMERDKADQAREIQHLQEQIEAMENRHKTNLEQAQEHATFDKEKALLARDREHQDGIQRLQSEYNNKVRELLERFERTDRE